MTRFRYFGEKGRDVSGTPLSYQWLASYCATEMVYWPSCPSKSFLLWLAPSRAKFYDGKKRYGKATVDGQATHLHCACHGQFNTGEPLESYLQLFDGRWTLREILDQQHFAPVRLATLSACQTAIVESERLPDEVVGLPAGFLRAGVPGVVATMWTVDDLSTALLMSRFYRFHLGSSSNDRPEVSPDLALCRAQRWLRDVTVGELLGEFRARRGAAKPAQELAPRIAARFFKSDPEMQPFRSPFYWAPFVFWGR